MRILFDNGAGSSPAIAGRRLRAVVRALPAARHAGSLLVPAGGGALADKAPAKRRQRHLQLEQVGPAGRPTSPATPARAPTGCGPPPRPTTGSRARRAPRSSYLSAPLTANTAIVGAGALDAWIKSSAPDVDLQVTVSEVRPDGKETFVQDGWLRASRAQARPQEEHAARSRCRACTKADAAPAAQGSLHRGDRAALLRGPRLPGRVADPGDDRGAGRRPAGLVVREHHAEGHATVTLAYSRKMPSRLILPLVPGVAVPTPLPPCPGLRGEPCRTYQPLANRGT